MKNLFIILLISILSASLFAFPGVSIEGAPYNSATILFREDGVYLIHNAAYRVFSNESLFWDTDGFLKFTDGNDTLVLIPGSNHATYYWNPVYKNPEADPPYHYDSSVVREPEIIASSELQEEINGEKVSYSARNMATRFVADCKCHPFVELRTAPWVEASAGDGSGETILYSPRWESHTFSILNGYIDYQNLYLFKANNRIKRAKVENIETGEVMFIDFEDRVEFKEVEFEEEIVQVKITILEVYRGSLWNDLAVSALTSLPCGNNIESESAEKLFQKIQDGEYTKDDSLFLARVKEELDVL